MGSVKTRMPAIAVAVLTCLLLAGLASGFAVVRRHWYTCVVCRAQRQSYRGFSRQWSRISQTPCSAWYAANVEPDHQHVWAMGPSHGGLNIFGVCVSAGSTSAPDIIHYRLSPEEQLELYQRAGEFLKVKQAMLEIHSQAMDGDREAWSGMQALIDWKNAGYAPEASPFRLR